MCISLTVNNHVDESKKVFACLDEFARSHSLTSELYGDLRLIIEETFINIINHGYEKAESGSVTLQIQLVTDAIKITFTDDAKAFNPITDDTTDIEHDDHSQGRMGLHIIKSLGDSFDYSRIHHNNVFTIVKHYTQTTEK